MGGAKMTASELADALKDMESGWFDDLTLKQAATMLRQQKAEINTLRNHGYKTQYELLRIEFLQQQSKIQGLKKAQKK